MDPKWSSILIGPLPAFKAFKSKDQKGCPRLMHWKAHSDIVLIPVEWFILFPSLLGNPRLFDTSSFNGLPKLLERILSLKSLTEGTLQELLTRLNWSNLIFSSLLLGQVWVKLLTLLITQGTRGELKLVQFVDHVLLVNDWVVKVISHLEWLVFTLNIALNSLFLFGLVRHILICLLVHVTKIIVVTLILLHMCFSRHKVNTNNILVQDLFLFSFLQLKLLVRIGSLVFV